MWRRLASFGFIYSTLVSPECWDYRHAVPRLEFPILSLFVCLLVRLFGAC